jgi:hypothetical protein
MKPAYNRTALLERHLPVLASAALAMFFVWFPLTDTDIWWHLAAGREMVAHKFWLYTDPFSYTPTRTPWIDLQWIFQLAAYVLYKLGGAKAIVLAKLAAIGTTVVLICSIRTDRRYRWIAALLAPLLIFFARFLVVERPILITIAAIVLFILCFERYKQSNSLRWLIPIPFVYLLWVNSQGLSALGIFIIGAYWLEMLLEKKCRFDRQLLTVTTVMAVTIAASLINPYGASGALLPLRLYSRIHPAAANLYSTQVAENTPLLALSGFDARYRMLVLYLSLGILASFAVNWRRMRLGHLFLWLGFLYLAFCAQRNILLLGIVSLPILAINLAQAPFWKSIDAIPRTARRLMTIAATWCALMACAAPILIHARTVTMYPRHRWISPFRFPEGAVQYLKTHPPKGQVFNSSWHGGYLIWQRYPENQVFIDGRFTIRSPEFFQRYLEICDRPETFQAAAREFNITAAVLPSAIFTRYQRLIRWLYESETWSLVYTDGATVVFTRRESASASRLDLNKPQTADSIDTEIQRQWASDQAVNSEARRYFDQLRQLVISAK